MGLTPLQARIARTFFALPEAEGFALAGGGALIVQRLVDRSTNDLDLFGVERRTIHAAADALHAALLKEGFFCEEAFRHPTLVRLRVADDGDSSDVDVAYDYQWRDSVMTAIGPARSAQELAVDKLLALFGRAAPRDFVDVFFLAQMHGIENLLRWAPEKDEGFSPYFFAESLGQMVRLDRDRFEVDDATFAEMTEFYAKLRAELVRRTLDAS
ncbi:MAG TPA: nucleotidyl transferase AbiEii/AbiGii toxin family protein [Acidimicrobiales bacterium]|jgi:hypothetical protein